MNTNTIDKQSRIEMALKFLNLLFSAVVERLFGYLWTKQDKATYPFAVSNPDERIAIARKAIELSDAGKDVYFGVNLMNDLPARNARVKAEYVTLQTATVADIDILGGTHTDPNKYPANVEMAKGFLPFPVSMLVDSGQGLHPYCLYTKPIAITAENRSEVTKRNKKFIDSIRNRAGKYAKVVDSVHDLPRVLRMLGTYNYKCGRENAPLCRLLEVSDVRFMPTELDEKLSALTTPKEKSTQQKSKQHSVLPVYQTVDDLNRHNELFCVRNGVVNLQTGELFPLDSKYLITQQSLAIYRPGYRNPTVDNFLTSILPDEETLAALIRFLGYAATGEVSEEKALFFYGGGNGKGTLTRTLIILFGSYATTLKTGAVLLIGRTQDAGAATTELNTLENIHMLSSKNYPKAADYRYSARSLLEEETC